MTLDRTLAPKINSISNFGIQTPDKNILKNGIPLHSIDGCNEDVVRITFIFPAGTLYQDRPLVSSITNSILNEGSEKFSSEEISEKLEYYGAYIRQSNDKDFGRITLFTLNRYINETLEIIHEIIIGPIFPNDRLNTILKNKKQNFLAEIEKVKVIGKYNFQEVIFGINHPYGQRLQPEAFDTLEREHIIAFHKKYYNSRSCQIVAAGKITDQVLRAIENQFGQKPWGNSSSHTPPCGKLHPSEQLKHFQEKQKALQSSIWIGKTCIDRNHEDYTDFYFTSTVLGGYFGSRLMKNIREEKGYTYGIGAYVIPLLCQPYFVIASEVKAENTTNVLTEIYKEIERLQQEEISEFEMENVRNYLLGETLRMFDGAFSVLESFISVLENNLGMDHYEKSIKRIQEITPKQIRETAIKYFDVNSLYEVVVGKK